jgi:hypothetical protein
MAPLCHCCFAQQHVCARNLVTKCAQLNKNINEISNEIAWQLEAQWGKVQWQRTVSRQFLFGLERTKILQTLYENGTIREETWSIGEGISDNRRRKRGQ